jgi:uridine phosphorylase
MVEGHKAIKQQRPPCAPRETSQLISARRDEGIIAVEMEAAALLAMGAALNKPVICLAHITNTMATREDDFEKCGDKATRPH